MKIGPYVSKYSWYIYTYIWAIYLAMVMYIFNFLNENYKLKKICEFFSNVGQGVWHCSIHSNKWFRTLVCWSVHIFLYCHIYYEGHFYLFIFILIFMDYLIELFDWIFISHGKYLRIVEKINVILPIESFRIF